ncbi:adenylate kinase 8 [Cotesia glomerata]|uniref:adenylate kinase 8 n=1 Tax=Cotesia glomerata TaxID=32391 RepID=UPI001D01DAB3|nr:adenylate kinase 8 [Cotesia glomerata]
MNMTKKYIGLSRYLPYLEKHRIYELFNDINTDLVIQKPSDPLDFIKHWLEENPVYRDRLRIILLSSPDFDKKKLAEYLSEKLNIKPENQFNDSFVNLSLENLYSCKDWIFIDFPRNNSEACALKRNGILPTHVFEIIDSLGDNSRDNALKAQVSKNNGSADYNLHINSLRDEYKPFLHKIESTGRTCEEIGNICISITRRQRYNIPCIYCVVLIGPRGSGFRTVAKYLSQKYGLVNVDLDYLIEQTKKQNSLLGEELRSLDYRGTVPGSEMRFKVVENKLMSQECNRKGWVLTRYPLTVEDFRLLNSLTTPPNRIIFLSVDQVTCRERLLSRRFNILTGSEHHLTIDSDFQSDFGQELAAHPKDYGSKVEQDQKIIF